MGMGVFFAFSGIGKANFFLVVHMVFSGLEMMKEH